MQSRRETLQFAGICIAIIVVGIIGGSGGDEPQHRSAEPAGPSRMLSVTSSSPIEWQLAATDAGHPEIRMGAEVPYQSALNTLAPYCTETRTALADAATLTREILMRDGKGRSTTLRILRGVRTALPDETPRMRCTDIFAIIATMGF